MGWFCTSSRTYSPRKSVAIYADEGPGPLTRGTTKITEVLGGHAALLSRLQDVYTIVLPAITECAKGG